MNIARRLLLLNGVSILAVIVFHATGWGLVSMFAWAHRYLPPGADASAQAGTASYFALRVLEQLGSFAVAAFIFVSGFFAAVSADRKTRRLGWKIAGQRVIGLLIPYLLWTVILMGARSIEGKPWSFETITQGVLTGATNPAYYFIPLLIQLYLFAPLLVPMVFARPQWMLGACAALQIAIYLAQYPVVLGSVGGAGPVVAFAGFFPKWFFPVRLFWFVLGMALGLHLALWQPGLTRVRHGLLLGVVVFGVLGVIEWERLVAGAGTPMVSNRETLIDGLYAVCVILSFVAWSRIRLPAPATIVYLGLSSFGIYLVHSPVMELAARAVYHLVPGLLAWPLIVVGLTAIAGLTVPLLLMAGVKRSPLRRAYPYLFG